MNARTRCWKDNCSVYERQRLYFRWIPRCLSFFLGLISILTWMSIPVEAQGLGINDRLRRATSQVDKQRLVDAEQHAGDWMAPGLDLAETHGSPLDQIHVGNVKDLGLLWSHDLGTRRGIEATPIVVDGILFFTGPWSIVYAFDARSGTELWKWDPEVDKAIYGYRACCDVVNRGVALYKGKIFVGVLDGRLVALDAATGKPIWQTQTVDRTKNYTITGAPRVVDGNVIIGNGGAEFGVRGFVAAYNSETGKLAWRTYTVPGDPALGFESKALEAAAKTWTGQWWKAGGGGTCWDSMAYDPELRLLYVGTGNGSPWNRRHRSPGGGDNLYLSSIIALRPETGELVWHFQTTPGDTWDFTATQPMILADLVIEGRQRKTIMQAPKNGFFYVLDRQTGEFISAKNYVDINWANGLDPKTGRPIERAGMDYAKGSTLIKPGSWGAHNWQPMAYNRKTGLVYIPAQEFQETYEDDPKWKYDQAVWNVGLIFKGPVDHSPEGLLLAWDPVAQKSVWKVSHPIGWNGGVLTTAGNLVFQGTGDGRLVAYDARTGTALWQTPTGTAIIAAPVTYLVDGRQYVTVVAGWGGSYGLYSPPAGDAANYEQIGRIYTFALGASKPLPSFAAIPKKTPTGPAIAIHLTPAKVARGEQLFGLHCALCHGQGGVIPDLRFSTREIHLIFDSIVRGGLYAAAKGMPSFREKLTKEEVESIQAFVVSESRKLNDTRQQEKAKE